jgi:hypothetical protein
VEPAASRRAEVKSLRGRPVKDAMGICVLSFGALGEEIHVLRRNRQLADEECEMANINGKRQPR